MGDSHVKSLKDLGLNEWLVKQCEAMGIKKPTPIQEHCTPEILKGTVLDLDLDLLLSVCVKKLDLDLFCLGLHRSRPN